MLTSFLRDQATAIARQVNLLRSHIHPTAMKAEGDNVDVDEVERILAGVDFAGWASLAGEIKPVLDEIARDGGYAALHQIHFDTTARRDVTNVVNEDALAYAGERSAELVGMRRNLAGDLYPNPDAKWNIDEGTRAFLRADVTTALREGMSNDALAAQIRESYAFSEERAMVIARTETQLAANQGAVNGYRASGVVDGKQWLTAEDDLVSEECAANGEAGPNHDGVIGLDDDYPSGDDAPPVHPNCRCTIAPYIDFTKE